MAEIAVHFTFILRDFFFLASKSVFFFFSPLDPDYLKSSIYHSAFQVDISVSNTTLSFLSSASLPALLQETIAAYYLLVLSPSLSSYL